MDAPDASGDASDLRDGSTSDGGPVEDAAVADVPSDTIADAAGADAGSDAGADAGPSEPAGCSGTELFCDDFESGEIAASRWGIDERDGSRASVSEEVAFEGRRSLRIDMTTVAGARAVLQPRGLLPVERNRFYGRFHLLVTPAVDMNHSFLVNATGNLPGGRSYYGLHSNAGRLNSRYVSPAITEHGGIKKFGGRTLPEDEWLCVEFLFDGEADEVEFWFDGVEEPGMRVTGDEDPPWIAPPFETIDIGFHTYQAASAPFSVYYDAIAFDTERIGCGT